MKAGFSRVSCQCARAKSFKESIPYVAQRFNVCAERISTYGLKMAQDDWSRLRSLYVSSIHIRVTDHLPFAQCCSSATQCWLGRSSGSRKCDSSYVPVISRQVVSIWRISWSFSMKKTWQTCQKCHLVQSVRFVVRKVSNWSIQTHVLRTSIFADASLATMHEDKDFPWSKLRLDKNHSTGAPARLRAPVAWTVSISQNLWNSETRTAYDCLW